MKLTAQFIAQHLAPYQTASKLFIGYSGGVDSHVLLHLLANIPALKHKLTAVYVHHGLQACAGDWAQHCQQISRDLGVAFKRLKVNAQAKPGQSPEEAARIARYQAFKQLLGKNDVLLFAQHRDDQLETVLLQLFRGAGLKGLSGMPTAIQFAHGTLLRPLLEINQQEIKHYVQQHDLQWIDDPSNQDIQFDRNFLRHNIIPLLEQRWPGLDKTVARVAEHCAGAQQVLSANARQQMHGLYNEQQQSLSIPGLLAHEPPSHQWILREWLHQLGVRMPTQKVLSAIMQDVLLARPEANPLVEHDGHTIQRYREGLYLVAVKQLPDLRQVFAWTDSNKSLALANNGILKIKPVQQGIALNRWQQGDIQVKYRQGGEKIALPNRMGRHSLKKLYQEAGIAPWLRDVIPLIYINGELAAIASYWINADFYSQSETCICLLWDQSRRND
ncbi:tRNA(Ile)-lysidine synthase [Bathymodiolus japonicus methanotrophic gill symbiont]|uniref:tRNA lysidine(34) synthetase TilS n=1 Tax=Bathymodiolus japonicus methanotrophic gill symbiont TaxID=113269 RepID=UPI001B4B3DEB|nr:tRNA lysidine(34) synthetase TilS [Bathymodiolus japonicus methanotrophic gill symbiont]GFO71039.1 tRNA(Ile)-lysidine synthase [Bathymodiolus japonicus methanotrophic gill symbiont]